MNKYQFYGLKVGNKVRIKPEAYYLNNPKELFGTILEKKQTSNEIGKLNLIVKVDIKEYKDQGYNNQLWFFYDEIEVVCE